MNELDVFSVSSNPTWNREKLQNLLAKVSAISMTLDKLRTAKTVYYAVTARDLGIDMRIHEMELLYEEQNSRLQTLLFCRIDMTENPSEQEILEASEQKLSFLYSNDITEVDPSDLEALTQQFMGEFQRRYPDRDTWRDVREDFLRRNNLQNGAIIPPEVIYAEAVYLAKNCTIFMDSVWYAYRDTLKNFINQLEIKYNKSLGKFVYC